MAAEMMSTASTPPRTAPSVRSVICENPPTVARERIGPLMRFSAVTMTMKVTA